MLCGLVGEKYCRLCLLNPRVGSIHPDFLCVMSGTKTYLQSSSQEVAFLVDSGWPGCGASSSLVEQYRGAAALVYHVLCQVFSTTL